MTTSSDKPQRKLGANRKALRDYHVIERLEAGIELCGTEVKSIRNGSVNLTGSFARIEHEELIMLGLHIPPYEHGNQFNHDPDRPRRLLMHKKEIIRLKSKAEQQGQSLIPLSLYMKRGRVKVEIGLCKGKRMSDKRETLKQHTADREAAREMSRH